MCASAFTCPYCNGLIDDTCEIMCSVVDGTEHRAFACPAPSCGATVYAHRRAVPVEISGWAATG